MQPSARIKRLKDSFLTKIETWLCKHFGMHFPPVGVRVKWNENHTSRFSYCLHCHKRILQDSYGYWFDPTNPAPGCKVPKGLPPGMERDA